MLSISVRQAHVDDAESVAELYVAIANEIYANVLPSRVLDTLTIELGVEHWRRVIAKVDKIARGKVYVAEINAVTFAGFGYCSLQRAQNLTTRGFQGEVQSLYLTASARRNGGGRALMAEMAAHLRQQNVRGVACWVLREDMAARGFYERLNGELIEERVITMNNISICTEVAYGWTDLGILAVATSTGSGRLG
jgi:ribosomal protein S18 acetylase RimI-like enzyme